jgi:NTE family protein
MKKFVGRFCLKFALLALGFIFYSQTAGAQSPAQPAQTPQQNADKAAGQQTVPDAKGSAKTGQDKNSASKPASAGEDAASTQLLRLGALDPSTPPTNIPHNRPVIGLAMGGGGAVAMSEIGALQWFEEHRIPVDVIAGTSMGSILAALYSTGKTPEQMQHIMTEESVTNVFRIQSEYAARNFRRREDSREVPNAVGIGLKHGAGFRNALFTDTGLNELLDREFLAYNDQTDFNDLPIPFRCQATDLNASKSVTFARGSLQDAVRASASIPGVFRPFELNGHEYVDGAILDNLPTQDVKAMRADVIIALSLPLQPVGKGDLDSIIGVLQRAFAVGIEANETNDRKLAKIVIMPDTTGFTSNDYLKTAALAKLGYAAAEAHKVELLPYALSPADWDAYIAHRRAKERGPAGTILLVKVKAPGSSVEEFVTRKFAPLVNQQLDTKKIDSLLADIRADGRYDADYTVGYDSASSDHPIILVTVSDKKTGPPFLDLGFNLAAQTGGVTRATVNTIFLYQDLGNYGSEFRAKVDFGFLTHAEGEYYRKLDYAGFFVAPRIDFDRTPYYIYNSANYRVSERQAQFAGGGGDFGWSDSSRQELRVGWEFENVQWNTTTGSDGLPDYSGNSQRLRVRYVFDSQDRALVPRYGIRSVTEFGYLYATPNSPSAPSFYQRFEVAHTFGEKNLFLANAEGGTLFNHDVAQPFRYTLGGPLRLSASAIDQYRGTDYFLVTPGYLRRIAKLPSPFGQNIYVGGTYEIGQMRAPDAPTITRQDVYFGVVAETPFGVFTFAPAIGTNGEHKFTFTIGKLF